MKTNNTLNVSGPTNHNPSPIANTASTNSNPIATYFDARAENWDAQSDAPGVKHLTVAQLAGVHAGARVLDIGCGTGIMERAYLELGASYILALDVSAKMIECAQAKFSDVATDTLEFRCADVLELAPAQDISQQFDCAVIYNAYPHILDRAPLIQHISELLVPGGRFLVAHGMSRAALGAHHNQVPTDISRELLSAREEAACWETHFIIDEIADTPFIYFFGGMLPV